MPIVHITLYAGRTRDQKAAAAREITDAIVRTLGATAENTQIIFTDVEKSSWAKIGKLVDEV